MRLLKVDGDGNVTLTDDLHHSIPPYAILSHTWGPDHEEVTFNDLRDGHGKSKVGYEKIRFCSEQSRRDGLEYFWIDTCCINKPNLSELAESINSMFAWYRDAERCYVYLSDVSSSKRDWQGEQLRLWEPAFRACRWFTRGWTLQELLAPSLVEFFSREGHYLGSKDSLAPLIQDVTGIPTHALQGTPLSEFSVRQRMAWASTRTTTKPEDRAYCLLGIFEVFLGPIYGERENAMVRLKDEIGKTYRSQLDDVGPSLARMNSFASGITDPAPGLSVSDIQPPQDHHAELLDSLGFKQMDSRRATIKSAYSTTCAWLLRNWAYMDWSDPEKFEQHCGFLWFKGKPGAGKSTLVKFALAQSNRSPKNGEILVSYFFNARGDALEKSTLGMYRSLLFQIFQKAEDLQLVFDDIPAVLIRDSQFMWTIEQLRELLTSAVQRLGQRRLRCFIDALDECDEQEIRDMVIHFEDLGQISRGRFYVCFASRHYPSIDIRNGMQLVLEDETGHDEDLAKYVQSHLRIGKGKTLNMVKEQVLVKANGVFMWVVLVIEILNEEFRRGRIHAVQKRLHDIPEELSDLFKEILRRDTTNMDDLLLCIQWILFAKTPLDRKEFYFAMLAGSSWSPDPLGPWDPELVSEDDMQRFVLDCSKGLAELTRSGRSSKSRGTSTVQFIHESVRDYLIKDGGLYELWPDLQNEPESLSHRQLSKCCQRYLLIDLAGHAPSSEFLPRASNDSAAELRATLNFKFPFLKYAAEQVFYHADQAAKAATKDDFLREFNLENWIYVANLVQKHELRRHTEEAPLEYLLAEHNAAFLFRNLYQRNGTTSLASRECRERYRYPFYAALVNSHWDAIQALLQPLDCHRIAEVLTELKRAPYKDIRKSVHPLQWAVQVNLEILTEMLVAHENTQDTQLWSEVVQTAIQKGHTGVLQAMWSNEHMNAGYRRIRFCEELDFASEQGFHDLVALIVGFPIEIDAEEDIYDRALVRASWRGHHDIILWLLDRGSHANANDFSFSHPKNVTVEPSLDYQTKLMLLERQNRNRLLLARQGLTPRVSREDITDAAAVAQRHRFRTKPGPRLIKEVSHHRTTSFQGNTTPSSQQQAVDRHGTALYAASQKGHDKVVRLLLEKGAVVENDQFAGTALHTALEEGHYNVIQLLLDAASPDVDTQGVKYSSALQAAALYGHYKVAKFLLDRGADVHAQSGLFEDKPLSIASRYGHTEVVELLFSRGANVNSCEPSNRSALYAALEMGHTDVAMLLCSRGANVNVCGPLNHSAPYAASENGHWRVARLLSDFAAGLGPQEGEWINALEDAVRNEGENSVKILTDLGAKLMTDADAGVNAHENTYSAALRKASSRGYFETVELLLEKGADVNAEEEYGGSALQHASVNGHDRIVELLLEKGANVNAREKYAGDALQQASRKGHYKVVKLLLEKGADMNAGGSVLAELLKRRGARPPDICA